jgi:hypothetical protein
MPKNRAVNPAGAGIEELFFLMQRQTAEGKPHLPACAGEKAPSQPKRRQEEAFPPPSPLSLHPAKQKSPFNQGLFNHVKPI